MDSAYLERVLKSAPSFYHNYIIQSSTMPLEELLEFQIPEVKSFFAITFRDRLHHRYAEGKWSPQEILGHCMDAERVFQYRAMRFARNDDTPLPGFDEDLWVPAANAGNRDLDQMLEEFEYMRLSGIRLWNSFEEEEKWRSGKANDNPISVIALYHATVGHYAHHIKVIRERYR